MIILCSDDAEVIRKTVVEMKAELVAVLPDFEDRQHYARKANDALDRLKFAVQAEAVILEPERKAA